MSGSVGDREGAGAERTAQLSAAVRPFRQVLADLSVTAREVMGSVLATESVSSYWGELADMRLLAGEPFAVLTEAHRQEGAASDRPSLSTPSVPQPSDRPRQAANERSMVQLRQQAQLEQQPQLGQQPQLEQQPDPPFPEGASRPLLASLRPQLPSEQSSGMAEGRAAADLPHFPLGRSRTRTREAGAFADSSTLVSDGNLDRQRADRQRPPTSPSARALAAAASDPLDNVIPLSLSRSVKAGSTSSVRKKVSAERLGPKGVGSPGLGDGAVGTVPLLAEPITSDRRGEMPVAGAFGDAPTGAAEPADRAIEQIDALAETLLRLPRQISQAAATDPSLLAATAISSTAAQPLEVSEAVLSQDRPVPPSFPSPSEGSEMGEHPSSLGRVRPPQLPLAGSQPSPITSQSVPPPRLDPLELADWVNEVLIDQARRHGVEVS